LSNSTFKYVGAVTFEVERRRLFRGSVLDAIARDPKDWYDHLGRSRCQSASLVIGPSAGALPGHVASAFAGGGQWAAVTAYPETQSLWCADWRAGDHNATIDDKIWRVRYREHPFEPTAHRESIAEASARLGGVLQLAEEFADDADLDFWRNWFQSAEEKLESESVSFEYHPDMFPPSGYRNDARALLSSCERAWVFGGMGSWNDLGFAERELQDRYDALTPKLYDAVLRGITTAVNQGI
jgi:hypothetical protein